MRPAIYYAPELHNFEHIGRVPWPHAPASTGQLDWISSMATLEQWLEQYVGSHYSHWAYAHQQDLEYWQACIAFRWAKHKTLFLLTWA